MIIITGKVIHGQRYGRELGFPTANLERRSFSRRRLKVRLGVYGGRAEISQKLEVKSKKHKAAIVIGPLDNRQLPKIEAHFLNFKGDLYGKKITISLEKYIRPFKKFKSANDLKVQIRKDINRIKKIIYGK